MLYSVLSASAILLAAVQAQGPVNQPPPVNPLPPQPQTNPVGPINPNTQAVTPVTPQQPPATPQYGYPQQQPYNPYGQQPQYNPYGQQFGGGFMPGMGGMVDPQNLNCEYGQCRNRRITLTPPQGFQLNCQQARQCDGLDLTLNVGFDPTNWGSGVSEIQDLNFDQAQNGVTIRINSVGGNNVEIGNIHCQQIGSCNNLKIMAGWGVETHNINVHCEMPGACNGCTINGQSCAMISMMNGNNNGYMPYGMGYTNTANVPGMGMGQPQQPGFGQPQGPPTYPGQGMGQPQAPQYPQGPAMPQQQYPQYPPQGYPNPMWI